MIRVQLLLVLSIGIVLSGCSAIPEIGRDLPSDFVEGDLAFNARVVERYRSGMAEKDLETDLQAQGFAVDSVGNRAEFHSGSLPCVYSWYVEWKAESDIVSEVHGRYGSGCL